MLMRQNYFIHSTVLLFFVFIQSISVVSSFIVSHQPQRSTHFGLYHRLTTTKMSSSDGEGDKDEPHCPNVLFIECGFGNDSHGQSSTKAAVRACRNAIEFNSIPSIKTIVPGGYDNLKLDVILAVPKKYQQDLDLKEVAKVFPYGEVKFTVQDGGMIAPNGIVIDKLGDKNEDIRGEGFTRKTGKKSQN